MSTLSPTTLSLAIETHHAAKAAWYAQTEDERNCAIDPLFDKLNDAEHDLATTPTASDAEFIQKLAYLFADVTDNNGEVVVDGDFGPVLAAMDLRFNPDTATD